MKPNEVHQHRRVALLIIDMINDFDFPQGKSLARQSVLIAENILKLKTRLKKHRVPVIYLNDNFGQWRSDWKDVYEYCTRPGCRGRKAAQALQPQADDYFILKPRHSGFFGTTLDILLKDLGVEKIILTGVAGNICILFTANDAHMRDLKVCIPNDCTASNTTRENKNALLQMKKVLGLNVVNSHLTVRV